MNSPTSTGSNEYPMIPVYLYTILEIIISVSLFTLTRAPLDISLPQVALYPHLSIALVPVLLLLVKRWGSRLAVFGSGSHCGFICKEKFLEEHEEIIGHAAVGDDKRGGAAGTGDHDHGNTSSGVDDQMEKRRTAKNKTVSYADGEDEDSLNMRRNDLAVWPSLTPDPHAHRRRSRRQGRSDWIPGFENESHGIVKERRMSSIVQVEVEPSSVPPPWELGNASARSRLR